MKHVNIRDAWVLVVLLNLSLLGCGRQKATDRVLEAFNPPFVSVTNGQMAVLQLKTGYAAVIPTYMQHKDTRYRIICSEDGNFARNQVTFQDGRSTNDTPILIDGIRIFLGYNGQNVTAVSLDFEDISTGIALFHTNNPQLLDVTQLIFSYGKAIDAQDLMKSIGGKVNSSSQPKQ